MGNCTRRSSPFLVAVAVALAGLAAAASTARAQSISRHERVQAKPITKAGQVVGFKLKVVVHSANFTNMQLGLGRASVREEIRQKGWDPGKMRGLLERQDKSYIRTQFPELAGLVNGQPKELELEVHYGKGNDLKPGDQVDVFSAWRGAGDGGFKHFFGVFEGGGHVFTTVTLPGAKPAAGK